MSFSNDFIVANHPLAPRVLEKRLAMANKGSMTAFRLIFAQCGDECISIAHKYVSGAPMLHHLELKGCALTPKCIHELCDLVRSLPQIQTLCLSNNDFTDECVAPLSSAIGTLANLMTLAIGGTMMTDPGLATIVSAVRACPKLRVLDLHVAPKKIVYTMQRLYAIEPSIPQERPPHHDEDSEFGTGGYTQPICARFSAGGVSTHLAARAECSGPGAETFAQLRRLVEERAAQDTGSPHPLEQLLLKGSNMSVPSTAAAACRVLPMLQLFTKLDLTHAKVTADVLGELCRALANLGHFSTLYLGENGCGDGGAEAVRGLLESSNTRLRSLGLQHNSITAVGCASLAAGLEVNTSLRELDLSHNGFGANGCAALCNGLKRNRGLQALLLDDIAGDANAVRHLCSALRDHPTMQHLDFVNNDSGAAGCDVWCEFFGSPSSRLRRVFLTNNGFDAAASSKLVDTLLKSSEIYAGSFDKNALTDAQTDAIKAHLRQNKPNKSGARATAVAATARPHHEPPANRWSLTSDGSVPAFTVAPPMSRQANVVVNTDNEDPRVPSHTMQHYGFTHYGPPMMGTPMIPLPQDQQQHQQHQQVPTLVIVVPDSCQQQTPYQMAPQQFSMVNTPNVPPAFGHNMPAPQYGSFVHQQQMQPQMQHYAQPVWSVQQAPAAQGFVAAGYASPPPAPGPGAAPQHAVPPQQPQQKGVLPAVYHFQAAPQQ